LTLDLLIILLLIAVNGFLSLSEMAVVSSRPSRLKELAATVTAGAGAKTALFLKEHPGVFLSTIQIGITLIGIASGAFGGTEAAQPLARLIARVPMLSRYAGEIAVTFVVFAITFLTLLLGELVPKNIALSSPEAIASNVARPMRILAVLLAPGVWILDRTSSGVLMLFGRSGAGTARVTEEEIKHLLSEGADAGAINTEERDIIFRIIQMGDKTAEDLMTPRLRMVSLDVDASDEVNLARMRGTPTTRFPVYKGDPTNIIGVVRIKDLLDQLPGPIDLFRRLHPPVFVSDRTLSNRLLQIIQSTDLRMVFVVDEYGTLKGCVTLSDITRPVIGETPQGMADGSAGITKRRDGSFLVDGLRPADDLKPLLGLSALPHGEDGFHTVAGLIIANLQKLPTEGDAFDFGDWRFEVIDMDGQRVDKVLITPLSVANAKSTAA